MSRLQSCSSTEIGHPPEVAIRLRHAPYYSIRYQRLVSHLEPLSCSRRLYITLWSGCQLWGFLLGPANSYNGRSYSHSSVSDPDSTSRHTESQKGLQRLVDGIT